jgi:hypothetical protein
MFSLPLGGSCILTASRGRVVSISIKAQGETCRFARIIRAAQLVHGDAHQLLCARLAQEMGLSPPIDDLIYTRNGGILLATFTFHELNAPNYRELSSSPRV